MPQRASILIHTHSLFILFYSLPRFPTLHQFSVPRALQFFFYLKKRQFSFYHRITFKLFLWWWLFSVKKIANFSTQFLFFLFFFYSSINYTLLQSPRTTLQYSIFRNLCFLSRYFCECVYMYIYVHKMKKKLKWYWECSYSHFDDEDEDEKKKLKPFHISEFWLFYRHRK